jgi:hypothetical protein
MMHFIPIWIQNFPSTNAMIVTNQLEISRLRSNDRRLWCE